MLLSLYLHQLCRQFAGPRRRTSICLRDLRNAWVFHGRLVGHHSWVPWAADMTTHEICPACVLRCGFNLRHLLEICRAKRLMFSRFLAKSRTKNRPFASPRTRVVRRHTKRVGRIAFQLCSYL